ncbi:DUF1329 domain-containing protein [Zoogloea sp.]|uniref:DUF1329 domain-containing protein n=1 Tax=Zoogloea sp. TaxID=49181 RepID=UPI0035AE9AEC
MKTNIRTLVALAVASTVSASALAAVTAEEAKQLGSTLTPWGAEKKGNKEGTIPDLAGPIKPPANFDPKNPKHRPDPFANEKPLYSIDAKNMDKHAGKLSEGIKAMMKKYAGFRIDVYPTHRNITYPQFYLDNSIKNATACKTINNGLQLEGCYAGIPFPIPKTGNEVMWNRLFKYDGYALMSEGMTGTVVDTQGNNTTTGVATMWIQYPIFDPKRTTPISADEPYEKIRVDYSDPARKAGEKLVVHDSVDMVNVGRRAWSYLPGQRRVKLSPDIAYDTPSPTGGGAGTVDEAAVFYGALDRYNFKLIGKKEMYIPYNTYKVRDPKSCPNSTAFATKNFLNPDCVRWELHRVWVVEATLKDGKRHVYPKRTLYWDEDMPGIGMTEGYDSANQIYRVTYSLPISLYDAPGHHSTDEWVTADLATGNYARQQNVTDTGGWIVTDAKPNNFFSSEALAGGGIR